ncbi:Hypothetical predicted protein [Olea europaea subsp. europaea]|uniref:Filament-like plant protein n=1 Tax=Olea europaea subsp. europaea TaxID=158383 RepID=A0A8S0TY93_OLEEU|nr:Hypothetical predicted protein [Olea europaea subsp. europaea]
MEKKKWLWKKRFSEKSPGESDSSGSISSHSERYSDEKQDALKDSPNRNTQSPEITSKAGIADDEVEKSVKSLTQKLSAALVNVSAKEDLVKQHAKVAEDAVAGWEKAENEVVALKQQLDAAIQQNLNLEVRSSHLDTALKECVRQLRKARETMVEKTSEWESAKSELKNQIIELQTRAEAAKTEHPASIEDNTLLKLKAVEKKNSSLKHELVSQSKELEIRTIERDLSTRAAEASSKLQLESIKKVAKLEAECRRLQSLARKSPSFNDQKSIIASSFYVESLTDSHSDSGERLSALEVDTRKVNNGELELNGHEKNRSDSWASALIAELDQFKNEKSTPKSLAVCSVEIDMMDDFLEMERLAALPEIKNSVSSVDSAGESTSSEKSLSDELERMTHRVAQLEEELEEIKNEKSKLENALGETRDSLNKSEAQLEESEMKIEELQRELGMVNEAKELLEFQLIGIEVEARTMSANIDSLKAEIEIERNSSAEMKLKCQELENELNRKNETEIQHDTSSNGELKLKQEDIAVAADKLAECQKTIASLGRQLQSLATLEDFLIDTANLPGFSRGPLVSSTNVDLWRVHSNDKFVPKCDSDPAKTPRHNSIPSINGNNEESPASSSSSMSSANPTSGGKTRNGFGKFFSRTRSGIELENHQG